MILPESIDLTGRKIVQGLIDGGSSLEAAIDLVIAYAKAVYKHSQDQAFEAFRHRWSEALETMLRKM